MLDTITSTSVIFPPVFTTMSSSTDGEDKAFLTLIQYPNRTLTPALSGILFDTTSYAQEVTMHFQNETFGDMPQISEEMLEHDIMVKVPPKKRFLINAKITKVIKAKPHIIIPENTQIDT